MLLLLAQCRGLRILHMATARRLQHLGTVLPPAAGHVDLLLAPAIATNSGRSSSGGGGEWVFSEHYIKREALVPMRDGVLLHTAVYSPKAPRPAPGVTPLQPMLMSRTCYGVHPVSTCHPPGP